ncbi:MAG: FAD:protein FMN transferase [Caldisericum sp.]|nr:FAD:protein FMN transferase [Caldisericum sp.]
MSNKKLVSLFSILFLLVVLFFYLSNTYTSVEIYSMDTVIDIKVWGINRFKAVKDIEFEINKLSALFDDFSPNSEVTLINNNAGIKPVKVSYETLDIITKAKDMYDKTDGNFNIMIAPVLKLWGFKSGDFRVPEKSEIEEALKLTDINDLIISGDEVFLKKKGESIDLGGIAKGYALDKVKDIIENDNVTKAVINMGGNVFVYSKNNNEIFTIGIKHPRENGIIATVKVKSGTFVATSGDYERFFEYKGVRYCHIFDPKTGFPANKIVSATAITKTGYVGDVLSTAMFVEGKDGAFELAKRLNASCIIVDKELNVFYTDDLKGVVSVENR